MDGECQLPAVVQGQLITEPSDSKPASGLCSPGLKKLLTEGEDGAGACRLILLNKHLRAECEQILPALQAAKAPATEVEILAILVRNAPTYGITAAGPGGWGMFFGAYLDALEGLPAYAVEDGFLRWNRGEGHSNLQMASFYPKPAQLVMLAQKGRAELFMAAYRAEKALAYVERKQAAAPPPPEVRKEMGAKLGDLLADLKRSAKPPATFGARVSPQQMAQQIRAQAGAVGNPTSDPAPEADDVGDVI